MQFNTDRSGPELEGPFKRRLAGQGAESPIRGFPREGGLLRQTMTPTQIFSSVL